MAGHAGPHQRPDDAYATADPGAGSTVTLQLGDFGFDAALPPSATIDAVTVSVEWGVSTTAGQATLTAQPLVDGTPVGSPLTETGEPTADTVASFGVSGLTRADLLDGTFSVAVGAARGGGSPFSARLDGVTVSVDYTVPATPASGDQAAYTYDRDGNRLSVVHNGLTTTYAYDRTAALLDATVDGITTAFGYDPYGNLTGLVTPAGLTVSTYDPADRLVGLTPPGQPATSYTRDALGRVATRTTAAVTDTYAYVGTDPVAWRVTTGASSRSGVIDPGGSRLASTDGSTPAWLLPDLHANLAAALDVATLDVVGASRYDAYGQTLATAAGTSAGGPWGFQARLDLSPDPAAPLYDFGARPYAPGLGVFTSLDTYPGTPADPLSMNRYLYAAANPATFIDPTGHYAMERADSDSPWDRQTWEPASEVVHYTTRQGCGGFGQPVCPVDIPVSDGTWLPPPGEAYLVILAMLTTGGPLVNAARATPEFIASAWTAFRTFGLRGFCMVVCGPALDVADDVTQIGGGLPGPIRYGPHNPGPLDDVIASTFRSSSYAMTELSEATIFYRAYGGKAGQLGSYWTRTKPAGPLQSQLDSALNPEWGNTAIRFATIRVPAGTTIYEGAAASQQIARGGSLPGGGNQVYIPHVDASWLVQR